MSRPDVVERAREALSRDSLRVHGYASLVEDLVNEVEKLRGAASDTGRPRIQDVIAAATDLSLIDDWHLIQECIDQLAGYGYLREPITQSGRLPGRLP